MVKKGITFLSIAGFATILYNFWQSFTEKTALPSVSKHYIENGPTELGSSNIVTSVVVTYRGLDTLGEVSILFAAAAAIGLLLSLSKNDTKPRRDGSELLQTGSSLLFPLIVLFGAYIFINGHLSPGGGFPGGAIIASAFMLSILADPNKKRSPKVLSIIESVSGITFVGLGVLGIIFASGFLDNRLLPLGTLGNILSAGIIPIIYSLIGLKVGAELSSIILKMNGKSLNNEVKS